ncbi:MAG: hypothetical protein BJ554DRAFT_5730, partial [Olpidium bornovanus]
HEQCLLNWISEKQREQDLGQVQVRASSLTRIATGTPAQVRQRRDFRGTDIGIETLPTRTLLGSCRRYARLGRPAFASLIELVLSSPAPQTHAVFDFGETIVRYAMPVITGTGLAVIGLLTSTTYGDAEQERWDHSDFRSLTSVGATIARSAHAVLAMCGAEEGERLLRVYHPWTWKVWFLAWVLIAAVPRLAKLSLCPPAQNGILAGPADNPRVAAVHVRYDGDVAVGEVSVSHSRYRGSATWGDRKLVYGTVLDGITATLTAHWTRRAPSRPSSSPGPSPASHGGNANNEEPAVDEGGLRELELLDRPQPARLVAGALLFPTISSVCGRMLAARLSPCGAWLRRAFPTIFLRSMAGGCAFVALKVWTTGAVLVCCARTRTPVNINRLYVLCGP